MVTFKQWDGTMPLEGDSDFDLIIAKMSLHYLSDDNLRALGANLVRIMREGGRIVFSVPSPYRSAQFNTMKRFEWDRRHTTGSITREIGSTGIVSQMFHRGTVGWIDWIWAPLKHAFPEQRYTVIIDDDACDETGYPKRLDLMFLPSSDPEGGLAYRRIERLAGPPKEHVVLVDASTNTGRSLLYGEIVVPPKPLP